MVGSCMLWNNIVLSDTLSYIFGPMQYNWSNSQLFLPGIHWSNLSKEASMAVERIGFLPFQHFPPLADNAPNLPHHVSTPSFHNLSNTPFEKTGEEEIMREAVVQFQCPATIYRIEQWLQHLSVLRHVAIHCKYRSPFYKSCPLQVWMTPIKGLYTCIS